MTVPQAPDVPEKKEKNLIYTQRWKVSGDDSHLKWQSFGPGSQGIAPYIVSETAKGTSSMVSSSSSSSASSSLSGATSTSPPDAAYNPTATKLRVAVKATKRTRRKFPASLNINAWHVVDPSLKVAHPKKEPSEHKDGGIPHLGDIPQFIPTQHFHTNTTVSTTIHIVPSSSSKTIAAEPQLNSLQFQPSYFLQTLSSESSRPQIADVTIKTQETPLSPDQQLLAQWRLQQEQLMRQQNTQQMFLQQQLQLQLQQEQQQQQQQQQLPPALQTPPGQKFGAQTGFVDVSDSENAFLLEPSTVGQITSNLTTILVPSGLFSIGYSGSEICPSKLLQQLDDSLVRSTFSR